MNNSLINKLLKSLDVHTLEVVKKSFSSMIVKVIAMIIALIVSASLGRLLGANGFGIIELTQKIVTFLIIIVLLGFPQLLIKQVAIAYHENNWASIQSYMRTAFKINGVVSVLTALIIIAITPWIASYIFHDSEITLPLIIALLAMTFRVFSRIYAAGLVGVRKIWQSSLVGEALSMIFVGIFLFIFWVCDLEINVIKVALFYAVGQTLVTLLISIYWKKVVFRNVEIIKSIRIKYSELISKALPFLFLSITVIVATSVDTFLLGILRNTKEVGIYNVAVRVAMITIFVLQITNSAIAPKIASLFAQKKIDEINQMVRKVTFVLMIIGVIPLLIFIFWGENILSIWGNEFKDGYLTLIILSIGQLFNIGTGASGAILIMCGQEKLHAYISIFSIILNLVLGIILIPFYGFVGAAIGTAFSIICENIIKVYYGRKRLGISTISFK